MKRGAAPRMDCPECGRSTAYSEGAGLYFLRRHLNPSTSLHCMRRLVSIWELKP